LKNQKNIFFLKIADHTEICYYLVTEENTQTQIIITHKKGGIKMDSIVYKPIRLIAEEFEKSEIKYLVLFNEEEKVEILKTVIAIDGGPKADVCFISNDDNNDLIVRIAGLITSVPDEKKEHLLKAFNIIHLETRYLTFSLSVNGDINVGYDFPAFISDDSIGKSAVEVLVRLNQILNQKYSIIAKCLYSSDSINSTANDSQE